MKAADEINFNKINNGHRKQCYQIITNYPHIMI